MRTGTFTMTPVPQLLLFALHMPQITMRCMQQTFATFRYKVETKDGWAYHVGDDADERMTAAAQKRDVHLTSKSRPLEPEDFQKFDFIVGMDDENIKAIKKAAAHWKDNLKKTLPKDWEKKVSQTWHCAKGTLDFVLGQTPVQS